MDITQSILCVIIQYCIFLPRLCQFWALGALPVDSCMPLTLLFTPVCVVCVCVCVLRVDVL